MSDDTFEILTSPGFDGQKHAKEIREARYHIGVQISSLSPEKQKQLKERISGLDSYDGPPKEDPRVLVVATTMCPIEAMRLLSGYCVEYAPSSVILFDTQAAHPVAVATVSKEFHDVLREHEKEHESRFEDMIKDTLLDVSAPATDPSKAH